MPQHRTIALVALAGLAVTARAQEPPRSVAEWDAKYGNHRALVHVATQTDAARVRIPWRRRDAHPERVQVVLVDLTAGKETADVVPYHVDREAGCFAFRPTAVPGDYAFYYLPSTTAGSPYFPTVTYVPASEAHPDPVWAERNGLAPGRFDAKRWDSLPDAEVRAIQARGEFHRFDPMEVCATPAEVQEYLAKHASERYLLFPEDTAHPIRMADELPLRWVRGENPTSLELKGARGECVVFQIGLWAARTEVKDVGVAFSLSGVKGSTLQATDIRCLNLGGTDWLGRAITKWVNVPQGKVQAFWCLIRVPAAAKPGEYRITAVVSGKGVPRRSVPIRLTVGSEIAPDAGVDDNTRLARLGWLDSTIGLDEQVVAPYTPLVVDPKQKAIRCLGRVVTFGPSGLPAGIRAGDREILAAPMALAAETQAGPVVWKAGGYKVVSKAPAVVELLSEWASKPLAAQCHTRMEADGYLTVEVAVTALADTDLTDIRLEVPMRREAATYLMGMGRKGGYRPPKWEWQWNIERANNYVWVGEADGGLQLKLKGEQDTWDLYNLRAAGIPDSWGNSGHGGCSIADAGADRVLVRAFSGQRHMTKGQTVRYRFGLLITPVKPLDPNHWAWRYYHQMVPPKTAAESGASIINVHQGNELNPYINYPFVETAKMAAYVKEAHAFGLKVKIYYTIRELSNRVAELFALRSLGYEVFTDGPGGGDSWLQEHLVSNYAPAWHTPLGGGETDAAIGTVGLSRWHNTYLEGLRWLMQNVRIDGLYLDGIGYDREIMKRVRKVMDRTRPGSLIDFHSGNNYAPEYGLNNCAGQYMEHFPYIDSIWFGEGFDYNETPDFWLVEVSGIPFGLYGEMLQDNGNPWRGMVYGMTARYYSGADPKHIWALWDSFGIQRAQMFGYWAKDCPVRTNNADVLATAYVREGKTLISLASWAKTKVSVKLAIDWTALGLDPSKAKIAAPPVEGFQPAAAFRLDEAIPVDPAKGWLLVVE